MDKKCHLKEERSKLRRLRSRRKDLPLGRWLTDITLVSPYNL